MRMDKLRDQGVPRTIGLVKLPSPTVKIACSEKTHRAFRASISISADWAIKRGRGSHQGVRGGYSGGTGCRKKPLFPAPVITDPILEQGQAFSSLFHTIVFPARGYANLSHSASSWNLLLIKNKLLKSLVQPVPNLLARTTSTDFQQGRCPWLWLTLFCWASRAGQSCTPAVLKRFAFLPPAHVSSYHAVIFNIHRHVVQQCFNPHVKSISDSVVSERGPNHLTKPYGRATR